MSTEPHSPIHPCPSETAASLLERLIRERGSRLRRLAASIAGERHAEDAVQAACLGFLRAYDPATAYGGLGGAYRYLAAATANKAANLLRGDRRRQRALPQATAREGEPDPVERAQSEGRDPAEALVGQEDVAEALAVLDELPDEWRAILVARAAGFTPDEIADATGLTPRQYRKRVEKANRCLADATSRAA